MCVGDFGGQFFRGRGVFMSRKSFGGFLFRGGKGSELNLSGAPSRRGLPGCLWGFPCLVDRYVVFVDSVWYIC